MWAVQAYLFLFLVCPKVSALSFGISCFVCWFVRQDCSWPEKCTHSLFSPLSKPERVWVVTSHCPHCSPFSQKWSEVRPQHLTAPVLAPLGAKVGSDYGVPQPQALGFIFSVPRLSEIQKGHLPTPSPSSSVVEFQAGTCTHTARVFILPSFLLSVPLFAHLQVLPCDKQVSYLCLCIA